MAEASPPSSRRGSMDSDVDSYGQTSTTTHSTEKTERVGGGRIALIALIMSVTIILTVLDQVYKVTPLHSMGALAAPIYVAIGLVESAFLVVVLIKYYKSPKKPLDQKELGKDSEAPTKELTPSQESTVFEMHYNDLGGKYKNLLGPKAFYLGETTEGNSPEEIGYFMVFKSGKDTLKERVSSEDGGIDKEKILKLIAEKGLILQLHLNAAGAIQYSSAPEKLWQE